VPYVKCAGVPVPATLLSASANTALTPLNSARSPCSSAPLKRTAASWS